MGNLLEQAQAKATPFNELSLSPTHPQVPGKVIFLARKLQTLKANRDKGLAVRKSENTLVTIDLQIRTSHPSASSGFQPGVIEISSAGLDFPHHKQLIHSHWVKTSQPL